MNNEQLHELDKGRFSLLNKKRVCMNPDCNNKAIRSHVLQKSRVIKHLKNDQNKIYEPEIKTLFSKKNGLLKIKKRGISEGFVFRGFCKECDSNIFKDIEITKPDLDSNIVLSLFAYRAVCYELRKKEIVNDMNNLLLDFHRKHWPNEFHYIDFRPEELSMKGLGFYKMELEKEIWNNEFNFNHYKLELTRQALCFSTSLTINDENNELTQSHDKFGNTRTEPLASSIVNYFPLDKYSYFLASVHKNLPCNWILDQIENLKNNQLNTISDFITFRTENWAISPDLFESLDPDTIEEFISKSDIEAENYNYEINSNFNLFDKT